MGVVKLSTAGILDYQKYSSFLAGNTAYSPSSYDLLQTEILTGTTASVTFSSLSSTYGSTYQHLQIRATLRTTAGSPTRVGVIRFGTGGSIDSGSNYSAHNLAGSGSSVLSGAENTVTEIETRNTIDSGTNSFGAWVMDIIDPFETTKYTTMRLLEGSTENPFIALSSGLWQNTGAVSDIQIGVGATFNLNFAAGSRFSLYGLKAA